MQELLIETIRTDGGVQSRERINEEYVAELVALIKGGRKLPPIEIYRDETGVWCSDGFHRVRAHLQAERRTIRCNIHDGGQQDAAWASCAANQEHGLRRTNADKRHAVEMALRLRPTLSARAVADHVGVDEGMVRQSKVRCGIPAPEAVVGRDGKTYRVPPPPSTSRPSQPPPPEEDRPRRIPPPPFDAAQGRPGGNVPPPPCRPAPPFGVAQGRLDEVGKPIPDHLVPLFDRAPEVQALLSQLSSVKAALKRAEEAGDVLFGDCNMQSALAGIQTAYDAIKATTPYAVCPWCHGTLSDQCRGCGHRGVLGKYRWDTTVQRELKG